MAEDLQNLIDRIQNEAVAKAMQLRKDGQKVEMLMKDPSRTKEDYNSYACKNQIKNVIWFQ